MKGLKKLRTSLAATLLASLLAVTFATDGLDCPVVGSTGSAEPDGTITVLGQLAIGRVTSGGGLVLDQGAVPCWIVPDKLPEPPGSDGGENDAHSVTQIPPP